MTAPDTATDRTDGPVFDPADDLRQAQPSAALAGMLSVYRADWHGIRSASAALPGHKLLLPAGAPSDDQMFTLCRQIESHGIRAVCFQGFSEAAEGLARGLRRRFGAGLRLAAVSHVTSTQFQAPFEIRMQAALRAVLKDGVLDRLGSVKPGFSLVMPEVWPHTLINFCPRVDRPAPAAAAARGATVFIPVENHWRKGLYTNLIAALRTPGVGRILSVHEPAHLGLLEDLSWVEITGFLDRRALFRLLAQVDVVMNVSLAECQPMTQLEAFAHGRPCLTGPLGLEEFADDELTRLCTAARVDTPVEAAAGLARLIALQTQDPTCLPGLIDAHIAARHRLAEQRYADFLGL